MSYEDPVSIPREEYEGLKAKIHILEEEASKYHFPIDPQVEALNTAANVVERQLRKQQTIKYWHNLAGHISFVYDEMLLRFETIEGKLDGLDGYLKQRDKR